MENFLNNQWAPITFSWAYVFCTVEETLAKFETWQLELGVKAHISHVGQFPNSIERLSELTLPPDKYLFVEFSERWTAVFNNSLHGGDLVSIGHLSTLVNQDSLVVYCKPNLYSDSSKRVFGNIGYTLYSPQQQEWLNIKRSLRVFFENSRPRMESLGQQQPFEIEVLDNRKTEIENLKALKANLKSFGIDAFNSSLYSNSFLWHKKRGILQRSARSMNLEQYRSEYGL